VAPLPPPLDDLAPNLETTVKASRARLPDRRAETQLGKSRATSVSIRLAIPAVVSAFRMARLLRR
jgi:hypothetical protein